MDTDYKGYCYDYGYDVGDGYYADDGCGHVGGGGGDDYCGDDLTVPSYSGPNHQFVLY